MGKIIRLADLRTLSAAGVIVWTNGVFDLLHAGHVHGLQLARTYGDRLVVGLNSDASVARLKPGRPIIPDRDRAELLAALACVDHVVIFHGSDPRGCIAMLRPSVVCKGEEYRDRPMPERDLVTGYGGRIEYLPLMPGISTSAIIRKIGASHG